MQATPNAQQGDALAVREVAVAIAHLAARSTAAETGGSLAQLLGTQLPQGPRLVQNGALRLLGVSPGRWLALHAAADPDFSADLAVQLRTLAAVCDLSDAYLVLELRGPAVRATLAKLLAIDLHERAFPVGQVATTVAAHIPLTLWRDADDAGVVFQLAVPRSYGACLREILDEAAAEFLAAAR